MAISKSITPIAKFTATKKSIKNTGSGSTINAMMAMTPATRIRSLYRVSAPSRVTEAD
jgi:hypothetical protein